MCGAAVPCRAGSEAGDGTPPRGRDGERSRACEGWHRAGSGKTMLRTEVKRCWEEETHAQHSWGRAGHLPVPRSTSPGPWTSGKQPEGAFTQVPHRLPLSFPPWGDAHAADIRAASLLASRAWEAFCEESQSPRVPAPRAGASATHRTLATCTLANH